MLTILCKGSLGTLLEFRLNGGDLIIIASMAMWAIYTIGLRWRPPGISTLSFLLSVAVIGDLCVLPLWVGEMALGRHIVWSWTNAGRWSPSVCFRRCWPTSCGTVAWRPWVPTSRACSST